MRILGIDPGTTAIGYAILERAGRVPILRAADLIPIHARANADRLQELASSLKKLLTTWSPAVLSIERLFFAKNQKTALSVAEARGVILLTTALAGLTIREYTPLEIKKMVTGDGRADKAQMKKMIHLTIPEARDLRARDDVFDAIGAALACFYDTRRLYNSKVDEL